ncbi:hypothetical protein SERLA73DRAFT_54783 [Serpula lacrymans var. lacrymans S7.3]|uniref:Peroxisomal membrane protein PEX14 n=2 Tax=Serpula lacrymans var. lacrymans TaxID=341189 RepID=F8PZ53_SERL3|nr:uncharacterized protein SERLADRAFT_468480 [Serpula lacrymans var. lacrymans S7.9]EGN99166.1 hypothetical protein SERLA73DRAFT_54783 [Serpula lacrymans var. lacrymans S7.3]EGO24735.1 hypothetical protein SERLADRAFT_468480 [Serpula lacrymans var. lacrymans S7.9]
MASPERQELIRSAVSFLSDIKTQQAPLAQRIQFLQAKGLTGPEIDDALKLAGNNQTPPPQYVQYPPDYARSPYMGPPTAHRWDWRDYFIASVVAGSTALGAYTLLKKYLLPHLWSPTTNAYIEDRDALDVHFDAAEALLKEIQAETVAVRTAVEEQKERVDKVTQEVDAVVQELREGETKTRDEMREIKDEVQNVREMLPKMIEKNKEVQKQSLSELQQEVKSMKALLLSRGSGPMSSSNSAPLSSIPARPSLPVWQLAAASSASGTDLASTPGSLPDTSPFSVPPVLPNGKGKEVELPSSVSS